MSLLPDCVGPEVEERARSLRPGDVVLLENLRFHAEEEANDDAFARSLAGLANVYVNDAFAAAHRAHASTEGIARHLQAGGGGLAHGARAGRARAHLRAARAPALGRCSAGPRCPTSSVLVEHLLDRVDGLAIGGGMAFTFLKAMGHGVGRSLLEPDRLDAAPRILERARTRGIPLRLPVDVVAASGPGRGDRPPHRRHPRDPGGAHGARHRSRDGRPSSPPPSKGARTIIWNGPMGVFEKGAVRGGHARSGARGRRTPARSR